SVGYSAEPASRRVSSRHDNMPIADVPPRRARDARPRPSRTELSHPGACAGRERCERTPEPRDRRRGMHRRARDKIADKYRRSTDRPMEGGESRVGFVGGHVANRGEIDMPLGDCFSDLPDRLNFRRRKAELLELVSARAAHSVVVKWIKCCKQPPTDRGGTRGPTLLAADNGAEAGKSRLTPAQAEGAGFVRDRLEPWVRKD